MLETVLITLVVPTLALIYGIYVWTITEKHDTGVRRAVQAVLIITIPFLGALLVHLQHNATIAKRDSDGTQRQPVP